MDFGLKGKTALVFGGSKGLGRGSAEALAAEGADADLTLLSLSKDVVVDKAAFESKSRNTPFHGWKLKGLAVMTIVGGRIVDGVAALRAGDDDRGDVFVGFDSYCHARLSIG